RVAVHAEHGRKHLPLQIEKQRNRRRDSKRRRYKIHQPLLSSQLPNQRPQRWKRR
ncbi:hypothetical protein TGVAND_438280, partial [Toxoplasma gondii VAND]